MKSAWSDHVPAGRIDPDVFLFMGADPVWTPDREYKSPDGPDAESGLCILCGGDPVPLVTPDGRTVKDHRGRVAMTLVEVPVGSKRVCARCMRSGRPHDHAKPVGSVSTVESIPDDPAVPVPCEDDPGFVERGGVRVPERFARLMKG